MRARHHRPREVTDRRQGVVRRAHRAELRQRLLAQLLDLLLDPGGGVDRASAQTALEEVDVPAREPGVRRAQEREQVAPLAVQPRVAQQAQKRLAERRLAEPHPALDRVRNAESDERGVERRAPAVDRRADDGDLLGRRARAQEREHLVGEQLERPAQACALEEPERAVQPRRRRDPPVPVRGLAEEPALEVSQHRRARGRVRRELLDLLGERGEVLGGTRERGERVASRLVRERDGHVRSGRERLEQRPFGSGQVLEAVREDRAPVPGVELAGQTLGSTAPLELAVGEAEPFELLSVGRVQLGELVVTLAVELGRLEQRRLELGHCRAQRVGEPGEPRGASEPLRPGLLDDAAEQQRALRVGHDSPPLAVRAPDPSEEVVERADRAAHQRTASPQELPLGAVDVRPVRHDQERIGVERTQIALEQARDLAGVGRTCEHAQSHRPILVPGHDGSGAREERGRPRPVLRHCGLRAAAASGYRMAGDLPGAVVAEIGLLRATTSICEVEPHRSAFSFADFHPALIANEHCFACQCRSSWVPSGMTLNPALGCANTTRRVSPVAERTNTRMANAKGAE